MPFLLKDETAAAEILYIDDEGNCGIIGSANHDQALSLESVGIITRSGFLGNGTVAPGGSSPLAGTIVIPIAGVAGVPYTLPQPPNVTTTQNPISVTETQTQWSNSSPTSTQTVSYTIW